MLYKRGIRINCRSNMMESVCLFENQHFFLFFVVVKLPFQLRLMPYLFVSVALICLVLYLKTIFL